MSSLLAAASDAAHHLVGLVHLADPAHPAHLTDLASGPFQPTGVPDVGEGEAPPGADGLLTVLKWVAWSVTALCVAGLFGVAARMAVDHSRGGGREHVQGLGFVMGACVLVGSASGIVGALI